MKRSFQLAFLLMAWALGTAFAQANKTAAQPASNATAHASAPAAAPTPTDARHLQMTSAEQQRSSASGTTAHTVGEPLSADDFIAPISHAGNDFITPLVPPPPPPPPPPDCPALAQKDLKPLIDAAAKKQSLQPEILVALASSLSSLKPCAVSPTGAVGLFQLAPDVVTDLKVNDPLDPKQNVDAAAAYLKQLADKNKGDMKLAISALYQSATGNSQPSSPEADKFAADVLADAAKPAAAASPKPAK